MRHLIAVTALSLAAASSPAWAEDAEETKSETYPYVEGTLDLTIGDDWLFRSDEPGNQINDLYGEGALAVRFGLTPIFSVNLGLTLEEVLDPVPFENRVFRDHGLYLDTLNVQADLGNFTFLAGKFGAPFGRAWDNTPGLHGTDFAEDYELAEQIGFSGAYTFDTASIGKHTLTAAVFFADNTIFSESLITNRGRRMLTDGGAGNTGTLNNFSVTIDGYEIPGMDGFSYHVGYRRLAPGMGDFGPENGFVAGVAKETELSNGMTVGFTGEIAHFAGVGGTEDSATYFTPGFSVGYRNWHGELAASLRRTNFAAGGNQNDALAQVSAGYTFDNGIDLSVGYTYAEQSAIRDHLVSFTVSKSFEFSTR